MFKVNGLCDEIKIEDKNINIKRLSTEELERYLEILNKKERQLIEEQNEYLSEILK